MFTSFIIKTTGENIIVPTSGDMSTLSRLIDELKELQETN